MIIFFGGETICELPIEELTDGHGRLSERLAKSGFACRARERGWDFQDGDYPFQVIGLKLTSGRSNFVFHWTLYNTYTVTKNMLMCNVVSVNGGILTQDVECEESRSLLQGAAEERGVHIWFLDLSETAKCVGVLTCCSVLLEIWTRRCISRWMHVYRQPFRKSPQPETDTGHGVFLVTNLKPLEVGRIELVGQQLLV